MPKPQLVKLSWTLPKKGVYQAALLFAIAGSVGAANDFVPGAYGYGRASAIIFNLLVVAAGVIAWLIAGHWLVKGLGAVALPLAALTMVALNELFGLIPAVMLAAWFVLIAVWIGLWFPRGTVFAMSPVAAAAYVLPLLNGAPRSKFDVISVFLAIPISVVAGEVVAASATSLRTTQLRLSEREDYFRALVESINDFLVVLGRDGTPRYASPPFLRLLGLRLEEMVDKSRLPVFVNPEDRESVAAALTRAMASQGQTVRTEVRVRDVEGHERFCVGVMTNLLDDPAVQGLVVVLHDISENKALEEQLRHQALHDPLTGVANRALVQDRLAQMASRSRRVLACMAVLYIDIDRFKDINDTLGHEAGDALLVAVSERLVAALRRGDTVGRLGGDEFVVLAEDGTTPVEPELLAQRILDVLAEPFTVGSDRPASVSMTASVGVAAGIGLAADELMRNADVALYQAKSAGRGRYVMFHPEMYEALEERLVLEADLRDASAREEFLLLYQPEVDLESLQVVAAEALIRWPHPVRGMLSPDQFLPSLEESGLIVDVGSWVLRTACEQGARWKEAGLSIAIAVNVSPRQLEHDLVSQVRSALESSHLEPENLVLELTEGTLLRNSEATIQQLAELHSLGVRIAIDDFGTGYSSMSYLRQFPIDILKIDRAFITGLSDGHEASTIVRTLVGLGHNLGLETIAEGIEQPAQLDQLRRHGCRYGQGFLFARPVVPKEVERLAREGILAVAALTS